MNTILSIFIPISSCIWVLLVWHRSIMFRINTFFITILLKILPWEKHLCLPEVCSEKTKKTDCISVQSLLLENIQNQVILEEKSSLEPILTIAIWRKVFFVPKEFIFPNYIN